jgi:ADP-ribosyl-[dinitrogen reductase] hydrolase
MIDKVKAVVIGHAIADALGVPVEFCDRKELEENPVTDMIGFGTYPYPEGSWSDDTSMSLATLESLTFGMLDYDNIMINFGKWYYKDEFTPTGEMFDVGNTCSYAIDNYFAHKKPINLCGLTNENSNGNGSLMRIHPVALYLYTRDDLIIEEKIEIIHFTSALTHAHERSKVACGIYAFVLWSILDYKEKYQCAHGQSRSAAVAAAIGSLFS